MAQSKATKRFEKHHLKDTLERRKGLKKVKQQQQLKAKKKARRVEENGGAEEEKEVKDGKKGKEDAFKGMSVDDFFQGGFEVPELPKKSGKRKRDEEEDEEDDDGDDISEDSFEQQGVPIGDASEPESEEDDVDHAQQLDALAANDPEFHKYLQDNEPELLDTNLDAELALSDDDEADKPKNKKRKKSTDTDANADSDQDVEAPKNELTKATVLKWQAALADQHSLRAAKEVVLAFRSAAHVSDDDEGKDFKYSVSSPQVYHLLLTTALTHIPRIFEHHLPAQESKSKKKPSSDDSDERRVHVPTDSKKFKTLAPLLRSHITSVLHLLSHLSDPATLRLVLTSTLPLLPYLLSFKKLLRALAHSAANLWSSSAQTEATRIAAFLLLRRLIVLGDAGIRENVLKAAYQALVRGCRTTTAHTLPGINLVKNSGAELWSLCGEAGGVAYTTAFTFIRQLAIHLRGAVTDNKNEKYKSVYNWQFVHGLDFWSRVLSSSTTTATTTTTSQMSQLIYPLVQTSLGALRLMPTATYFPLRFQLIRSLLRVSKATGTYIPLAPSLYEVLASAEMRRVAKSSTLKPLDFEVSIRAGKGYLRTRVYQDGVGEQVVELLSEFFAVWARSIAFPELSLAVIVGLKRWLRDVQSREQGKGNRNGKVNGTVGLVVGKLEQQAKFVEEKRALVEFAPENRKGVEGFLEGVEEVGMPLGAFVVGQRKVREERRRVVEEGRKQEEGRRVKEGKGGRGGEDEGDGDGDSGEDLLDDEEDDDESE